MSGYTPLFSSLTTGTLCGKWPDIGLWAVVLSQSDRRGILDVTPDFLALITGLPVDEVVSCMARFCQPDPRSRSKEQDGARLVLIDPARDWGWRIVNHSKYRERARLASKNERDVETGKNAERMDYRRNTPETAGDRREPPLTDPSDKTIQDKRERAPKGATRSSKRCPEDFSPDLTFASAEVPDMDAAAEAQKFKDWEFKTARKDWPACWRTWVRNARDSGRYAKRSAGGWY